MAYHLERRWKNLFNSAFYRQTTLEPTKMKFAEMTFNEINTFCDEVSIKIDVYKCLFCKNKSVLFVL